MLDWILEWDKNLTEISGDHVATPNAFIGNKDGDGKLTGVYIGGGEIIHISQVFMDLRVVLLKPLHKVI